MVLGLVLVKINGGGGFHKSPNKKNRLCICRFWVGGRITLRLLGLLKGIFQAIYFKLIHCNYFVVVIEHEFFMYFTFLVLCF